jgi:hypothetical protein
MTVFLRFEHVGTEKGLKGVLHAGEVVKSVIRVVGVLDCWGFTDNEQGFPGRIVHDVCKRHKAVGRAGHRHWAGAQGNGES